MTRSMLPAILAAGLFALPAAASAEGLPAGGVADALIAAVKAQDRQAALQLLDEQVSIRFPSREVRSRQATAEGRPFVIGYLDGLFDARRGLSLQPAAPRGEAVRFLARDARDERYAIEVEVRHGRVVGVTVNRDSAAAAREVAALR